MVTIIGESGRDDSMWTDSRREIMAGEKRVIITIVAEAAVIAAMTTYLHSFNDKVLLQRCGGSIGTRGKYP